MSPLLDMLRNDPLPKVRCCHPYYLRSIGVFLLLEAAATYDTYGLSWTPAAGGYLPISHGKSKGFNDLGSSTFSISYGLYK